MSTKEERQKKYRQSDGFILCDLQSLYLNCEKSLLHPFVIFLPHNVAGQRGKRGSRIRVTARERHARLTNVNYYKDRQL